MTFYLKCKYCKGMFSHEGFIKFKPYKQHQQNWYFVNKEDIIPSKSPIKTSEDMKEGLVKIVVYSIEKNKILAGINDTGDHRESRFYVSKEDVCKLKGKSQCASKSPS